MNRSALTVFGVVVLLAVHLGLAAHSVRHKSNTFDELIHLTSGYSYWKYNDYRFQPENGNFPQRWAAVPLLFMDLAFPEAGLNVHDAAHEFFFRLGNDGNVMLFRGRMMIAGLSLVLGLGVWFWASRIFGPGGGLISLALYCFSPTILAHGRLTTSDLAAALFFILSVGTAWKLLHRITLATVLGAALAVSGLLLSKMSGVLILPVSVLLVLARVLWGAGRPTRLGNVCLIRSRAGQAAAAAVAALAVASICLTVIWGAYGFRYESSAGQAVAEELPDAAWQKQLEGAGGLKPAIAWMRAARLLPEAYLYGFTYVVSNARERPAFLMGQYSDTGWWYFFPFCLAVKTPLVSLLVIFIAALALVDNRNRDAWYALSPLFCFFAVYWAAAVSANINIGHRHILPVYPAMFIVAGAAARWRAVSGRGFAILAPLVAVVLVFETQWVHPHYLAFFNAAAGGPSNGYRLLADSSLDWGQDLPGLARWIDARRAAGEINTPFYLAYFGTASPVYHRVDAKIIPLRSLPWFRDVTAWADSLCPGYYCLSATELQQVYGVHGRWNQALEDAYRDVIMALRRDDEMGKPGELEKLQRFNRLRFARLANFLRQREPDARIGYSILVYRLERSDLLSALAGPFSAWNDGEARSGGHLEIGNLKLET